MYELNMGFDNERLYRGCEVIPQGAKRYNLVTPTDSAVVIVASNLTEILKTIPADQRSKLVLTGAVPPEILLTVVTIARPHFESLEFLNGKKKVRTTIPQPPVDFRIEKED